MGLRNGTLTSMSKTMMIVDDKTTTTKVDAAARRVLTTVIRTDFGMVGYRLACIQRLRLFRERAGWGTRWLLRPVGLRSYRFSSAARTTQKR